MAGCHNNNMKTIAVLLLLIGLTFGQWIQDDSASKLQTQPQNMQTQKVEESASNQKVKTEENPQPIPQSDSANLNPFSHINSPKPPKDSFNLNPFDHKNRRSDNQWGKEPQSRQDRMERHRNRSRRPKQGGEQEESIIESILDSNIALFLLSGAAILAIIKVCTKRGKPSRKQLTNRIKQLSHQTSNSLQEDDAINESIHYHQNEIIKLKSSFQELRNSSPQISMQ